MFCIIGPIFVGGGRSTVSLAFFFLALIFLEFPRRRGKDFGCKEEISN